MYSVVLRRLASLGYSYRYSIDMSKDVHTSQRSSVCFAYVLFKKHIYAFDILASSFFWSFAWYKKLGVSYWKINKGKRLSR